MNPLPLAEDNTYRPLLKYRARGWAQAAMYAGLSGFVAFLPISEQPGWVGLVLVAGSIWLGVFGLVVLLTVETLRLEVSRDGVVYRNMFGRVAAAPDQVVELAAAQRRPALLLDQNRFRPAARAFWVHHPPYSDGSYIPLYLFLDPWRDRSALAEKPLGGALLAALPDLFEPDPPEAYAVPEEKLGQQALPPEAPTEPETPLIAGHYRLRSRSSVVILILFMLVVPMAMALAGLWGAQTVLLPGLLGGWMLTLLLGGVEARPTALTDLIGLAAVLLLAGLAALFLMAGCAFSSSAAGCTTDGFRANLVAFFFYPFVMYLIPWLLLSRLPRLLRRK